MRTVSRFWMAVQATVSAILIPDDVGRAMVLLPWLAVKFSVLALQRRHAGIGQHGSIKHMGGGLAAYLVIEALDAHVKAVGAFQKRTQTRRQFLQFRARGVHTFRPATKGKGRT